jgi:hypothetical protein
LPKFYVIQFALAVYHQILQQEQTELLVHKLGQFVKAHSGYESGTDLD